jgi:hypothetical protein
MVPTVAAVPAFQALVAIGRIPDQMQLRSVTPVRIRPNGAPPQTARILIRTGDHITVEPRNLTGMNAGVHPQNRRHYTHKARNRHSSAG